ncbi:MAG: diguanylate cyclase [Solirubrobacterales bacterium]|nr:diguanylate cyclase [Solirubrobacterales bacterium]
MEAGDPVTGIVIADATDPSYPITYVSPGFEALTGYAAEEVLGRNCKFLQGPETDPRAVAVIAEALADGREAHVTLLNHRADGTPFWNELTIAPQRDADGDVVSYLGVQKDVTDRMAADARIAKLAYYDALTGLANRAQLHGELRSALRRARTEDRQLALFYIDLDDFKRINDRHGHHVGDAVLRAAADRLRGVVRPSDLLARQGGDEFLLLVPDIGADATAIATELAARIVAALREPLVVDGVRIDVRASVGMSTYPRDAATADQLLRHADAAMYVAKGGGKDAFHLHRPEPRRTGAPSVEGFDPHAHVEELDRLLREDGVRSLYQPIVDLATGHRVGYEALARGPEGSALERPDRLFATADAAGRTVDLDWACRIAAVRGALDAGLGGSATLFVNCEPRALGTPCPPEHAVLWERARDELDLMVEITERAVTDRPAELTQVVGRVRAEGHAIALDDLGADVRSLALLPLVEPDVVKLDLSLVQDRPSTDQAAIVSAVAAERERTGAAILAEGIETEHHVAIARTLGATLGQGWLWGRPAPLDELVRTNRVSRVARATARTGDTPFDVVAAERQVGEATKRLLLPMSHHLEHQALRIGEGAVILSAFQEARHFTPNTVRRYEVLARSSSLVAAFGVGLPEEPVRGVRGAHLDPDDPLAGEWSVVVLGPHFAGALVGRDLGDTDRPDRDRRFAFATVYDRGLVIAAARTLVGRIAATTSVPALEL